MAKKLFAALILSVVVSTIGAFAAGPQTGGFGLGGNPRGGQSYAFFEFAPSTGAGMGAVAPYPNWLTYSEAMSNAAWFKNGIGVAAPTVTDDFGTTGVTRLQLAATLAGSDSSDVYQAPGGYPGGSLSVGLEVQGNGTSGTIDVCRFAYANLDFSGAQAWSCSPCAYTSSAWVTCTAPAGAQISGSGYIQVGNVTYHNGGTLRAAQDVLVRSARMNAATSLAPYVATTSAAKGFTPTGARNEPLTFTRASTAMATATAGGGLATTGIQNGDLRLMPNNQPRVVYDANGTLGLLVEAARTNINLRSEEWENAVYLLDSAGVAVPTRTANQATALDGTLTADRINLPATTAGQASLVRAAIGGACASVQCAYTVYVRGVSTSGTVDMGAWGSTVASAPCVFVSTSWTRCERIAAVAGTPGIYVGNDTLYNGGINRPAQDIYVWGGQQELGAYATSYIPTVAATVTRVAETASFPSVVAPLTGSTAVSVWFPYASTSAPNFTLVDALVGTASGWRFSYISGNARQEKFTPGVAIQAARTWSAGNSRRWASGFDGTTTSLYESGVSFVSGAQVAATSPAYTPLGIGWDHQGFDSPNVILSRVCVDPDPSRCR